MKTKQLIKALEYKESSNVIRLANSVRVEIVQKLREYDELKRLALDTIDAQEGMFLFLMSILGNDLEGGRIEYFQEEEPYDDEGGVPHEDLGGH